MITANLIDHHSGTGTLRVLDNGHTVSELDFRPNESGPNAGSLMGTANHLLPDLGYELAYGWMDERESEEGTVYSGRAVRLGDRTDTWD